MVQEDQEDQRQEPFSPSVPRGTPLRDVFFPSRETVPSLSFLQSVRGKRAQGLGCDGGLSPNYPEEVVVGEAQFESPTGLRQVSVSKFPQGHMPKTPPEWKPVEAKFK
jgi:hypothetical protein